MALKLLSGLRHVMKNRSSAILDAASFLLAGAVTLVLVLTLASPASAEGGAEPPEHYHWSFQGPFGSYDRASMQRGYQVYKQVCAQCHGMDLVAFRHLGNKGAPFYDSENPNPIDSPYIKQIAAEFGQEVRFLSPLDEGGNPIDCFEEPTPAACVPGASDYFPNPYRNDLQAKAANGGALPPDFSTISKARHHGPDYLRSLLLGYVEPPEGLEVPPGSYYNKYYEGDLSGSWDGDPSKVPAGGFIAMAPPILDGMAFEYRDGTPATPVQMSTDVAHFLEWASHPHMEARKNIGRQTVVYLLILAGLLWFSYRQIWRNVKH